jgi:hypothetical protein
MTTAVAVLLTAVCAALTYAVLACLRTLAALRTGAPGQPAGLAAAEPDSERRTPHVVINRALPGAVATEVASGDEPALIAVVSEHCTSCAQVLALLRHLEDIPVTLAVIGPDSGRAVRQVGPRAATMSPDAVRDLVAAFHIESTPVLVSHQHGRTLSSGFGELIKSSEGIRWLLHPVPDAPSLPR